MGLAHGAAQGAVVFLAGLAAFVALVWLSSPPAWHAEAAAANVAYGRFVHRVSVLVGRDAGWAEGASSTRRSFPSTGSRTVQEGCGAGVPA